MSENKFATRERMCIELKEASFASQKIFGANNKVWISGVIEEDFEYSHSGLQETFYKTRVRVQRNDVIEDFIPIIVPKLLLKDILKEPQKGKCVEIGGQLRSYSIRGTIYNRNCNRLELFVFVKTIKVYESENVTYANAIYLDGAIVREPWSKHTATGKRITDLMISVNREYKKRDYIPCIAWDSIADVISELKIGDGFKLYGRLQTRQYLKRYSYGSEVRTVYEISIMEMEADK